MAHPPLAAQPPRQHESAEDALVAAYIPGRVTATRAFKVLCAVLVPFCLALPALLLGLAATGAASGPDPDTSRTAQLVWAACLLAVGALVVWTVGRSGTTVSGTGITRRWGWGTVVVPWTRVSGFAAFAGRRPGLWVLPEGEAPLRVPTPWHRMSFAEAREASDAMNRACGIVPPHTWGAPIRGGTEGPVPRPLASGADDAELQRILTGNVLRSGRGVVSAVVLAPLGLVLPLILCVLAAASPGDTSRPAQTAWAVILFCSFALALALAAGTGSRVQSDGISVRSWWRGDRVRWGDVQAFLPDPSGLIVLTSAGQRVKAPMRLATSAGRERSAREAAYLNGTFGLGVPLRQCLHCTELYFEQRAGVCHYHPERPVCLGTLGEGAQRRSWWMYRCCWLVVLSPIGPDGRELEPPVSAGCIAGAHVAPDWVVPAVPEVPIVESSLRSWAYQEQEQKDGAGR